VVDRYRQFADPVGEYALDVALPQREPIVVPGRKVADVKADVRDSRDLGYLALLEEGEHRADQLEPPPDHCHEAPGANPVVST
jgi:hypothetical protein